MKFPSFLSRASCVALIAFLAAGGTDVLLAQSPPPVISTSPVRVAEGNTGAATAWIPIYLSEPAAAPVSVEWATADGTAAAGSDYTAASGVLTFAPGETFQAIAVEVAGDIADEYDERFTIALSNPSGATLADSTAAVLIRDDELPTVVSPSAELTVLESMPSSSGLTPGYLSIANPVESRTIELSLTGGTVTPGDLSVSGAPFPLGAAPATPPVAGVDDALTEGDETFALTLVNPGPAVLTIPSGLSGKVAIGAPPVSLAVEDDLMVTADGSDLKIHRRTAGSWSLEATLRGADEGGVFAVALHQGTVAADFRNTGIKIFARAAGMWAPEALLPLPVPAAGTRRSLALQDDTLVIGVPAPAGQADITGEVRIHERHRGGRNAWGALPPPQPPLGDVRPDFGDSVCLWGDYLTVGAPGSYAVSLFKRGGAERRWSLIRDFVRFSPHFGKAHAVDGATVVFTQEPALLTSRRVPGSAEAWSEPVSQRVLTSFPGQSKIVLAGGLAGVSYGSDGARLLSPSAQGSWSVLATVGSSLPGALPALIAFDGKTLLLTETGGDASPSVLCYEPAPLTGVMIDDESIRVTVDDAIVEGGAQGVVNLRLSRPLPAPVEVTYTLVDGTATADSDYTSQSEIITFQPGETVVGVMVQTIPPLPEETGEWLKLHLSAPSIGSAGPDGVITIGGPLPYVASLTTSWDGQEGSGGPHSIPVTCRLNAPVARDSSLRWTTGANDFGGGNTASAGSDFLAASGILHFPAGADSATFSVQIEGDTKGEPLEAFFVKISSPYGLAIPSGQGPLNLLIRNDDAGTLVDDAYSLAQGEILSGKDVRANDTDVEEVTTVSLSALHTLLYNGAFSFRPHPNFIGIHSLQYQNRYPVSGGPEVSGTVTIHVTDAGLPPVISDDKFTTKEDTALDLTASAATLLTNDGLFNADGVAYDPVLEVSVTDVRHGTVTGEQGNDGRLVFTPGRDFSGNAEFRYRVRDKDGWSNHATVTVRVSSDLPLPPLQRLAPWGSRQYRAHCSQVLFSSTGAVDHTVRLLAGQTVSLRTGFPLGRLEIRNADGEILTGGQSESGSLENVPVPSDGEYTIFAGGRDSGGTVTLAVNAGLPLRPNATTPYSLDTAFSSGTGRAAVSSLVGGGAMTYVFSAAAGDPIDLHLVSSVVQGFTLQQPLGTTLASSSASPGNTRSAVLRRTAPTTGLYYVVVAAANTGDYTLQLRRGSESHEYAPGFAREAPFRGSGYLDGRGVPESGAAEPFLTFGAFGDYGSGSANSQAVAAMVKSWNPDFLIAAGDHNYALDYTIGTGTWETNVGRAYGDFIKSRADNRYPLQTSPVQRYFPVPGNHDTGPDPGNGGELSSYLDYFHSNPGAAPRLPAGVHQPTLSYYQMTWGNADFFFLDSDNASVNPTVAAAQRQWLKQRISASTARWKFGIWHHPPFSSSSSHGSHPFIQWGADFNGLTAIITGHDHIYERLDLGNGLTQFIVGTAGQSFYGFLTNPVPGSVFRDNTRYSALKTIVGTNGVKFEQRAVDGGAGTIIDSLTIGTPPGPVVATGKDSWPLTVRAGGSLRLSTRTPRPAGALTNTVNPLLRLLDASGAVVATASTGAGDGINAVLNHTLPSILGGDPSGQETWVVEVVNESAGDGEYELLASPSADAQYAAWAAARLAGNPAALPQDDPDRDGLPNLLEFLLDSDPALAGPGSAAPLTPALAIGGAPSILIRLPETWSQPVHVSLQSSESLAGGSWTTLATKSDGGAWTPASDGGPVPVAADTEGGIRYPAGPGSRGFYRLALSLN